MIKRMVSTAVIAGFYQPNFGGTSLLEVPLPF